MALADTNRIGTNIGALGALNALTDVHRQLEISRLRLSTGKRINEAADDPAGYSVVTTLSRRARGMGAALKEVQTTENLLAVAEGGLQAINDLLLGVRDLAVQASSDTLGTAERNAVTAQLAAFEAEIDRIAVQTTFNGSPLLDGSFTGKRFQTGETANDAVSFSLGNGYPYDSFNLLEHVRVSDVQSASQSQHIIDSSISRVTADIQSIGSMVQRLRLIETNLGVAITNTSAAKSRILDVDVAREQASSTRLQILQQLGTAQLAQANIAPAAVLALFQ